MPSARPVQKPIFQQMPGFKTEGLAITSNHTQGIKKRLSKTRFDKLSPLSVITEDWFGNPTTGEQAETSVDINKVYTIQHLFLSPVQKINWHIQENQKYQCNKYKQFNNVSITNNAMSKTVEYLQYNWLQICQHYIISQIFHKAIITNHENTPDFKSLSTQ